MGLKPAQRWWDFLPAQLEFASMSAPDLKYRYHDSSMEGHTLGPRRELMLDLSLDSVWNLAGPKIVRLRFGAIDNIHEVRRFFERQAGLHSSDRVERIARLDKERWTLDLHHGGELTIVTNQAPQEQSLLA